MANVLIASDRFPPDFTGAGLRALRLAQRMSKKYDTSFQVLCKGEHNNQENIENIIVKRIRATKEQGVFFPFYLAQVFLKTNIYLMRRRKKIDIIHFFSFSWMNRMIMLANILFYKKKTILEVTLDGSDDPRSLVSIGKMNRTFKRFTVFLLRKIDTFIVGSKFSRDLCISTGLDEDKFSIVARPCEREFFGKIEFNQKNELRKKLGLPANKFILLNVGAIYARKNQAFLVKCVGLVRNRSILLVLVGPKGDEPYYTRINEYIKKHKLENQIIIKGEQKNINEYMIASDLLVFASKKEGFPNAVAESIMSGLPVVTTNLECVRKFITPKTGIIIKNKGKFNDIVAKEFGQAITTIFKRQSIFNRMTIRNFGIKNFSSTKIDIKYYELYQELLSHKDSPNRSLRILKSIRI